MFNRRVFLRVSGGIAAFAAMSTSALANFKPASPVIPSPPPCPPSPEVEEKLNYLSRVLKLAAPLLHQESPVRHTTAFLPLGENELAQCLKGDGVACVYTQSRYPDVITEGQIVCVPTFQISHIVRSWAVKHWGHNPVISDTDLEWTAKQIVDDLVRQEQVALDAMPSHLWREHGTKWEIRKTWGFGRGDLTVLFFDQPNGSPGVLAYEDFGLCYTMGRHDDGAARKPEPVAKLYHCGYCNMNVMAMQWPDGYTSMCPVCSSRDELTPVT